MRCTVVSAHDEEDEAHDVEARREAQQPFGTFSRFLKTGYQPGFSAQFLNPVSRPVSDPVSEPDLGVRCTVVSAHDEEDEAHDEESRRYDG